MRNTKQMAVPVLYLIGLASCVPHVETPECPGPEYCSGHGTCRVDSGELVCECDHGYQGESCQDCIYGYDRQPDGLCLPTIGVQIKRRLLFQMGSPEEEPGREADETQHLVTLTRAFEMMDHEVTQEEFERLMGWNPSYFGPQGPGSDCGTDCPVETVSWFDAVAYAHRLSEEVGLEPCFNLSNVQCEQGGKVGDDYMQCFNATRGGIESAEVTLRGVDSIVQCQAYRLPTEAEWEYAARGLGAKATHNGDLAADQLNCQQPNSVLDDIAWFCGNSADSVHPVREKTSNYYKLYDMSGNVQEWVWDWYADYDGSTDPQGPAEGSERVQRGGSWSSPADDCRSANRAKSRPGYRGVTYGFRVVRSSSRPP